MARPTFALGIPWMVIVWCLLVIPQGSGSVCNNGYCPHDRNKLIVILVDGVRYDYTNDSDLHAFLEIARNGVRAQYVTPIFPANSYPNWQTIVTGLYAESHGVVDNFMYSSLFGEAFKDSQRSDPFWWRQAEPLWITAEKRGIRSAVYWWDGCHVQFDGYKPSLCKRYRSFWEWSTVYRDLSRAWVDIMDKFENGYDLAMVYHEAVDAYGHVFGPESNQRKDALRLIDMHIENLMNLIKFRRMEDKVNLVIVSDHGMLDLVKNVKTIVNISDVIDINDVELMLNVGSVAQLRPVRGRANRVYRALRRANLKGIQVYRKRNIPERYHIKNNHRTQEILLVADPSSFIYKIDDPTKMIPYFSSETPPYKGFHGYDPEKTADMRTIMYAKGPAFKKGYVSPPMRMVDHYNLFCHLLNIDPLPNNGTWSNIKPMLTWGQY